MEEKEELQEFSEKKLTYKEKRREKAKEKRHKDQMSVTIFGLVIYSIVLICIVVFAYIGFKSGIKSYREKAEAKALEEKRIAMEEAKALEEQKRAEEEAANALEEEVLEEDEGYVDSVFSVIENVEDPGSALVNGFIFSRKSLNDESGKLMDYEIYTNPENGQVQKITTRENCGDLYEVTDYYYDDGKINYIAQYREDTDIPIDLAAGKIESRFYYNDNKMVRYIYCENDRAVEYTVDEFDKYSEGTIGQYQYMEDMMLEASKTAYKNAASLEENVLISGYVLDELNCATKEAAKVELLDNNGSVIEETETNGDGFYSFNVKPSDEASYTISVSGRDDMKQTKVYGIKVPVGTKNIDVETIYLAYTVYDTVYPVQMFVKDADDVNIALSGAEIRIRYDLNNREGETCLSGKLGDAGEIIPMLRSGNYTAEIKKEGYETCYVSFTIKGDHAAIVAYATRDVAAGDYKCVLSYETTPLDLDLRVFDTYGRNVARSTSDSVGITMAENIPLYSVDSGTYTFYVSDYTDIVASDMMSYRLSESGAKVSVYSESGLESTFSVPAGHAGVVWRPFEIRNNRVIPINDYYPYIEDSSIFKNK